MSSIIRIVAALALGGILSGITFIAWHWSVPEAFFGTMHGALPNKLNVKYTITIVQIIVLNAATRTRKITQSVRNHTEETHMFLPISARTVTFIIWIALTLAVLATKFSMV